MQLSFPFFVAKNIRLTPLAPRVLPLVSSLPPVSCQGLLVMLIAVLVPPLPHPITATPLGFCWFDGLGFGK